MMARKILIGILIVLGIAVAVMNQLILGIVAVGVWIYLFIMIRKEKNRALNDQMESRIHEGYLKRIKTLSIVAVFSFFVFIVCAIVHNVSHGLSETEDLVFFISSLVALLVFIAVTAIGLFVFLKGRKTTT